MGVGMILKTLTGLLLTVFCFGVFAQDAKPMPVRTITVGALAVQVEVAQTEEELDRGLMGRPALPDDRGMLFVFDHNGRQCFWMEDTPVPLDIAFIRPSGSIANVATMRAETTNQHCSKGSIYFALEMREGWLSAHGIKAGAKVTNLPTP